MLARSQEYSPTILSAQRYLRDGKGLIRRGPDKTPVLPGIYRLLYIEDGVLRLRYGDQEHAFGPEHLLLLQPGQMQQAEVTPGSRGFFANFIVRPCKTIRIRRRSFSPADAAEQQPAPQAVWGFTLPLDLDASLAKGLVNDLRHAVTIWWQDDWHHFRANAILAQMLLRIAEHYRSSANTSQDNENEWLVRVQNSINTRIQNLQTTADLAVIAGLSVDHFAKSFKAATGERPAVYLRRNRLEQAITLVRQTRWSVAAVAMAVGYRDASALCHAWKTRFDVPPLQWRKRALID